MKWTCNGIAYENVFYRWVELSRAKYSKLVCSPGERSGVEWICKGIANGNVF